ncbi:hypothetical protein TNCV_5108091 [Trichonephila clavipes]|nr:hypothetical protein TNCV_5108091 [Trichonephila clavipes]
MEYASSICAYASKTALEKLDYVLARAAKVIVGAVSSANNLQVIIDFIKSGEMRRKLMKGQLNGLDFTVIMSHMKADMYFKGKKITENSSTSTLGDMQKRTIYVDMKPLIRRIGGINGFQSDGMKSNRAKVILPHDQSQIQSDIKTINSSGFM